MGAYLSAPVTDKVSRYPNLLRTTDPVEYTTLSHPGAQFRFTYFHVSMPPPHPFPPPFPRNPAMDRTICSSTQFAPCKGGAQIWYVLIYLSATLTLMR